MTREQNEKRLRFCIKQLEKEHLEIIEMHHKRLDSLAVKVNSLKNQLEKFKSKQKR